MKKPLLLCGAVAAILYLATVLLGGWLRPGYSHLSMAISELVADGAPNRAFLSPLFLIYNVLLAGFGIGLLLKANEQPRGRITGIIGSIALVSVGIAGLSLELAFPQEPGGTATTFAGTMHFVMAGVASLGTMVAVVSLGLWFRAFPALRGYFAYSMISFAVIFVSGGLSVAAMAGQSPLFGLNERVTIFTFIFWVLIVSLKMSALERNAIEEAPFALADPAPKSQ